MGLEVKRVTVDSLRADPSNARKHDKKNLAAIQASLKKFGQVEPLVVQKSSQVVIGGNGRLEAMKALGWEEAAIVEVDVDSTQAAALGIALNRTAELASWDEDTLGKLLQGLREDGLDLAEIGFELDDLDDFGIGGNSGITEENQDQVPEVKESFVKRGEIWELGQHRLMCGDSTKKEDVERLMAGEKADMVFTDPPYGVKAVGKNGTFGSGTLCAFGVYSPIVGDETTDTAKACYELSLAIGARVICLWGGNYYSGFCPPKACWLVWDKRGDMAGNTYADCELAWTNLDSPSRCYKQVWAGMIREGEKGKRVHPTQKPVALAEWAFGELDPKGKNVLDLFLGSGSTLIACEKTNRRCFGMEIDEHYCSVIIKRYQDLTGKEAKKVG